MTDKSDKDTFLRSRGNAKSTITLSQATGRKSGSSMRAALYEVYDEMTAQFPATAAEVARFCKLQIRRSQINLRNARKRKDHRAMANLQRKLAVYEYLYSIVQRDLSDLAEDVVECPHCRVYAMKDGVCSCCGAIDATRIRTGTLPEGVVLP